MQIDTLQEIAALRAQGRFQNPRQTPVRSKLRLKRFPNVHGEGEILYTTADWRSPIYILEGVSLHFECLGEFNREGGDPQKGGYFGFPRSFFPEQRILKQRWREGQSGKSFLNKGSSNIGGLFFVTNFGRRISVSIFHHYGARISCVPLLSALSQIYHGQRNCVQLDSKKAQFCNCNG